MAASTLLGPVLRGCGTGRVLAVFPTALYVEVGADVLAVIASDGLRLPIAAVLASTSATAPFTAHRAGDRVSVQAGGLQVGAVRYAPGRWWSPRAVRAALPAAGPVRELGRALVVTAPAHDPAVERALSQASSQLRSALVSGHEQRAEAAADAVLGLGPGLTPSGDDLLAGLLVTCAGLPAQPPAGSLGRHVAARAAGRTTALSAALLRCAAAGAAAAPVLDLVDAVAGRRPLAPALAGLLAVGHTSGHDTARGVHLAAEVLLARTPGVALPCGASTEEAS